MIKITTKDGTSVKECELMTKLVNDQLYEQELSLLLTGYCTDKVSTSIDNWVERLEMENENQKNRRS